MRSLWLCAVALVACEPVLEDGADGGDVLEGVIDGGADPEADSGADSGATPDSGQILEGPVPQEICGGTPVYVLGDPAVWDSRGRIELPELVPLSSRFNRACDGSEGDGGDEVVVRFMTERPGIYLFDVTGPATQVSTQRACADNWMDACYPVPPPADPEGTDRFVRFPRRMGRGELAYVTIETTGPIHLGVQAPGEVGEVCGWQGDVWVAECEEGLVCARQVCVVPEPPQLDTVEVWIEGEALHVAGAGVAGTSATIWAVLNVLDADGNVLNLLGQAGSHGLDRVPVGEEGRFQVTDLFRAWGQAEVLARAARVEVWAESEHGRGEAITVVPGRLPRVAPGDACDPRRVVNRCEVGSVCTEGADRVVACQPWSARAWRHGTAVAVRMDIPTADRWTNLQPQIEAQVYRGGLQPSAPYEGWALMMWADLPEATEIRVGFATNGSLGEEASQLVPIEVLPVRALGAECDVDRFMDVCEAASACQAGRCVGWAPPVIDEARAFDAMYFGGGHVLQLEGHDAEGDVERIDVSLVDQDGEVLVTWPTQPVRPWLILEEAGPRFVVRWQGAAGLRGAGLRVQLTDAQGVMGPAVVAPFEASDVVGAGEACQFDGAPAVCDGETVCVSQPGQSWPHGVCEPAEFDCPADWPVAVLTPGSVQGEVGAVDRTEICPANFGQGRRVPEDVYRFTAPEAGAWRFSAQQVGGASMAVAVRRACADAGWGSEVACDTGVDVRVPLAEGETVYLVVEPVAPNAVGRYFLTAER